MQKFLSKTSLALLVAFSPVLAQKKDLSSILNPDISLIMDSSFVSRSIDAHQKHSIEIPGFTHSEEESGDHGHDHAGMNEKRGFNFNYAELGISADVDPDYSLNSIFHLGEDSFEIEEIYFKNKNSAVGVKVGKFLSSFGRLNNQHHHYWSFADRPLVHKVFFGNHGLNEKGIALNYVLPTDSFVQLGVEVLNGENESSFGNTGFEQNSTEIDNPDYPNLVVLNAKFSKELSENITFLGGISLAKGDVILNHGLGEEEVEADAHALVGDSRVLGLDFSIKHDINSYSYLLFENEYISRKLEGKRYDNNMNTKTMLKKQAGFYSSLHYKLDSLWGVGARYERLHKNDVIVNGTNLDKPDNLSKYSLMAEYTPSEFTKIRLQYNRDSSGYIEDDRKRVNEVILQFNLTIGAHGAHKF